MRVGRGRLKGLGGILAAEGDRCPVGDLRCALQRLARVKEGAHAHAEVGGRVGYQGGRGGLEEALPCSVTCLIWAM